MLTPVVRQWVAAQLAPNYSELASIRHRKGGLNDSVRAVASLRNVRVIDLSGVLDEDSIRQDFAHPDQAGAVQLAEAIASVITRAP